VAHGDGDDGRGPVEEDRDDGDDDRGPVEEDRDDGDDDGLRFLSICSDMDAFGRIDPMDSRIRMKVYRLCSFQGRIDSPLWQRRNHHIYLGCWWVLSREDSESRLCTLSVCLPCSNPMGNRRRRTGDEARTGICANCICISPMELHIYHS